MSVATSSEKKPSLFPAFAGTVILLLLFGAVVWAFVSFSDAGQTFDEKRAQERLDNLKALREQEAKQLSTYGWVDQGKGVAHIPIDRAIELTIADLKQKPVRAAYPVMQAAAPAPANNAAPAAPKK